MTADQDDYVHTNGMWWNEAPIPWRWHHRCRPWTRGHYHGHTTSAYIERCACGAIRIDKGRWLDRNSRRKGAR